MRHNVRICLTVLVTCVATAFLVGAWLWQSPRVQSLRNEAVNRSPHELIRYLKKRLQGHNKLETVFLPPLHAVNATARLKPTAANSFLFFISYPPFNQQSLNNPCYY